MRSSLEIYFSYAWDDKNQEVESREKLVNALYESLVRDRYNVIRDKDNMYDNEFITDFMAKLGKGKCIIVAISKKYLRSPNCMFELYEIARHSKFDKYHFRDRILPIMVESVDLDNRAVIEAYFSFWQKEYNAWSDLVKAHTGQLAVEQMQRFDRIRMIYQHFGKLMEWLADLKTLNPEVLSEDNFAEIKKAIARFKINPQPNPWRIAVIASVIVIILTFIWLTKRPRITAENEPRSSTKQEALLIKGYIKDSKSKMGLKEVDIQLYNDQDSLLQKKRTDSAGYFELGTHFYPNMQTTLRISRKGYQEREQIMSFDSAGSHSLRISLLKRSERITVPIPPGPVNTIGGKTGITSDDNPDNGEKRPPEEDVTPAPTCSAICVTRGIAGVEVSFTDTKRDKTYTLVSGSDNLVFRVPCDLLNESIRVTFRKNGISEDRNFKLKEFMIPDF